MKGVITPLDAWSEGYLAYLQDVRRLAPYSIRDFRCALRRISVFMAKHRPGVPVWKCTLEDCLAWLNESREAGYHEAGLSKELSHVRGFLEYSYRSGRCERNVLDGFSLNDRVKPQAPTVLTLDEAQRLVKTLGRENAAARRCRLIVLLLYGCGLRTNELRQLDVGDVNIERQELFVRNGKGGFQRYVPVPGTVWVELLACLTERGGKRGPLFRTVHKKRRLRSVDIGAVVAEAASRAGIDWKVTPKTLRHSFGTHLMDRGVDIGVISMLMGHRGPNETGVYLHVLPGRKEQAVDLLPVKEVLS
ncbi:MAG: tyrosine-type recombinase/integrase [Planctomycetota bacterium]